MPQTDEEMNVALSAAGWLFETPKKLESRFVEVIGECKTIEELSRVTERFPYLSTSFHHATKVYDALRAQLLTFAIRAKTVDHLLMLLETSTHLQISGTNFPRLGEAIKRLTISLSVTGVVEVRERTEVFLIYSTQHFAPTLLSWQHKSPMHTLLSVQQRFSPLQRQRSLTALALRENAK